MQLTKKRTGRLLFCLVLITMFVMMTAMPAFAGTDDVTYEGLVQPIVDLLNSLLKPLLLVVGAAGTLYCVVLGVKYARAEEPQDREKAKQHLKGAIIGFVLIFILIVLLNQFIGPLAEWASKYQSSL